MIDWKILASAFIALLVVSFILMEGFGTTSFFSGTLGSIGEWFGSSPFGDLVPVADARGKHVNIMLYTDNLTLESSGEIGIETGTVNMTGFSGSIHVDFERGNLVLAESETKLKVTVPIKNIRMSGFTLDKLSLENSRFAIEPDISTENGTIEIKDFFGSVTAKENGLELDGNVTRLTTKIGDLSWELS